MSLIHPRIDLSLSRSFFELQKNYLHEKRSDFNQNFIGVLRPSMVCLVSELRRFLWRWWCYIPPLNWSSWNWIFWFSSPLKIKFVAHFLSDLAPKWLKLKFVLWEYIKNMHFLLGKILWKLPLKIAYFDASWIFWFSSPLNKTEWSKALA